VNVTHLRASSSRSGFAGGVTPPAEIVTGPLGVSSLGRSPPAVRLPTQGGDSSRHLQETGSSFEKSRLAQRSWEEAELCEASASEASPVPGGQATRAKRGLFPAERSGAGLTTEEFYDEDFLPS